MAGGWVWINFKLLPTQPNPTDPMIRAKILPWGRVGEFLGFRHGGIPGSPIPDLWGRKEGGHRMNQDHWDGDLSSPGLDLHSAAP